MFILNVLWGYLFRGLFYYRVNLSLLLVGGLTHYGAKPLVSCSLDVNNLMHILNMHKSLKSLIQLTKLTAKLEGRGEG